MTQLVNCPFQIRSNAEISDVFQTCLEELLKTSSRHLTHQGRLDLKTAFYEAVANAIAHAGEIKRRGYVAGKWFWDDKAIGFEVWDHGAGFNLEGVPVPDFNAYQSSGRGVFMMKQLGDQVSYKIGKSQNVLKFKRYLVGRDATTREIDFLYDVSEAVLEGRSVDTIYQMILDQAVEIFHVDRASVLIYDEAQKTLKVSASRGLTETVRQNIVVKVGEGVSGYVFQHGRPLLIEDIDTNRRGIEKKKHYKSKSFISVPLIYSPTRENEKIIGVINLTDRQDGKRFTKKDLKILSTLANQAMASLYIRDLLDEVRESAGMKHQLEIVRGIQENYLPKEPPHLPGFDLYGVCEMADSLGGDYYDYHVVGPFLYLIVADVSGHNIESAMSMFNFRSQWRALLPLQLNPGEMLTHLNKSLCDDLRKSSHFVSCTLLRIHVETREWKLASSGHYPPLFAPERFQYVDNGMVMGVESGETFHDTEGVLEKGDQILLYTDGVIEAMDAKQKFFGLDRLKLFLRGSKAPTSEMLVKNLVEEVKRFRDAAQPLDDLTVLALRYRGSP